MADVADLAGVDEVGEDAERLVDVDVRVVAVDLVKVDPVGPQPPQRILDLAHDPAPRVAAVVGIPAHGHVHLGREHDVVALGAGQHLADDDLGLALRVDIGGVDEVDPDAERTVDDPDALVVILGAPVTEHHGPEAQLADRDAGASQRSMLHWLLLISRGWTRTLSASRSVMAR